MLAYMSFVFVCELVPGENASCAAGQPPRRAAQAEPGRAGSGSGRGGGQAGERGTRGSAGVLQGEHEPVEKHGRHRVLVSQLCDICLIALITAARGSLSVGHLNVTGLQDDLRC